MKDINSSNRWTPAVYSGLSRYYDRLAPLFLPIGEKAKERVADALESGTILDIACGTGALLARARNQGLQCYGLDNAPGMIAESGINVPDGFFQLASFYAIPYPDNTFDYVVETNAVSGVEINAQIVMEEMVRVCKPGGQVLIGDYCRAPRQSGWTRFLERVGRFIGDYPHDFGSILTKMGFEPVVEILGWRGMYQFIRVIKP